MQVSVETLSVLERKLRVSVPAEKIKEAVAQKLKTFKHKVKVPGFRPGKVPDHIINSRYTDSALQEVAREIIHPTLKDALEKEKLNPTALPLIEAEQLAKDQDFIYTALFEIFPEINLKEIGDAEIEVIHSKVKNADIDEMLQKLREQTKLWEPVKRKAAEGDKVRIDFEGFIEEKPFEGGAAKNHEMVIGSGSMIPGFEEGIIGAKDGASLDIHVTFPKDYGHKELAGKEALFKIKVHEVLEGKLPEMDEEFAKKFNIQEGGVEALKKDIKENMARELDRRVSALNKEHVFSKILAINEFPIPKSMIDSEIENLKHEMYHRLFGHEHHDNEKIPDFPRALFEVQAKQRVHLGLLFSEYVKQHNIKADKNSVNAMIDTFASAYEKPEELHEWYAADKSRLAEIESLVLEEKVAEKISEHAKKIKKEMSYDEIMNPKKETKE
jgi:trigger factor